MQNLSCLSTIKVMRKIVRGSTFSLENKNKTAPKKSCISPQSNFLVHQNYRIVDSNNFSVFQNRWCIFKSQKLRCGNNVGLNSSVTGNLEDPASESSENPQQTRELGFSLNWASQQDNFIYVHNKTTKCSEVYRNKCL